MEVEIKLNEKYKELMVWILTNEITDDARELMDQIRNLEGKEIAGYKEMCCKLLKLQDIISFYAENKKVYARTEKDTYQIRYRLFELEELLDAEQYIRISNSEIINKKWIARFDLGISGSIGLTCKDGSVTFVSRRYVKLVRNKLGV